MPNKEKIVRCKCGQEIFRLKPNQFGNSCDKCQKERKRVANQNAERRRRILKRRGSIPVPDWVELLIQKANMDHEFRKNVSIDWLNHWNWLLQHRKDMHINCLARKHKKV